MHEVPKPLKPQIHMALYLVQVVAAEALVPKRVGQVLAPCKHIRFILHHAEIKTSAKYTCLGAGSGFVVLCVNTLSREKGAFVCCIRFVLHWQHCLCCIVEEPRACTLNHSDCNYFGFSTSFGRWHVANTPRVGVSAPTQTHTGHHRHTRTSTPSHPSTHTA
jgi:hypothetical protein